MDGYSYINIFETKGIEYLIIISFLVLIIPFWVIINKAPVKAGIDRAIGIFSESLLHIPAGILLSKNHTWTHLGKSGIAEIGIDDFLFRLTGAVKFTYLRPAGFQIRKGDILTVIDHDGKLLNILSPVSGTVTETNEELLRDPALASNDPYGQGWICRLKPIGWNADTGSCLLADEAIRWLKSEFARLRDFIAFSARKYSAEPSNIILQDGGELRERPLDDLPAEVWNDFQKSFLIFQDK